MKVIVNPAVEFTISDSNGTCLSEAIDGGYYPGNLSFCNIFGFYLDVYLDFPQM